MGLPFQVQLSIREYYNKKYEHNVKIDHDIANITISPNNKLIAITCPAGKYVMHNCIIIYNVQGKIIGTFYKHHFSIKLIAFSSDCKLIAIYNHYNIYLWDIENQNNITDNDEIKKINVDFLPSPDCFAMLFVLNNTCVVYATKYKVIFVNVSNGPINVAGACIDVGDFTNLYDKNKISSIAYLSNKNTLVIGYEDGSIMLFDLINKIHNGHENYINIPAASSHYETNNRFEFGVKRSKIPQYSKMIGYINNNRKTLIISPDDQIIVSVSNNSKINLWKSDGDYINSYVMDENYVTNIIFLENKQIIAYILTETNRQLGEFINIFTKEIISFETLFPLDNIKGYISSCFITMSHDNKLAVRICFENEVIMTIKRI
jgi:WD40 repeat protein